jgi:hypothetical protein
LEDPNQALSGLGVHMPVAAMTETLPLLDRVRSDLPNEADESAAETSRKKPSKI